jgi:hypothetical protein
MSSSFVQKVLSKIHALEPLSHVAVITYVGSLCPVTRAHISCVEEARKIVMDEPTSFACPVSRPAIEKPDLAVAVISVNSDFYVRAKLRKNGEVALTSDQRLLLIDFATKDLDWVGCHHNAWRAFAELKDRFPNIRFSHFEVDGADVALNKEVWTHCADHHKWIVLGRSCGPGEFDQTKLIVEMINAGEIVPGNFIMGPILPDISSTKVRAALNVKDIDALREMLHPDVLEWLLAHNPYAADDKAGI